MLGQKMIDPTGDDLEDLSVITYYVASTLENCKIILASKLVQDDDESDSFHRPNETKLSNRQKSLENGKIFARFHFVSLTTVMTLVKSVMMATHFCFSLALIYER